jgi:RNA polymerase sigma-70 factor, ECF subfamily
VRNHEQENKLNQILAVWDGDDGGSLNDLMAVVYDELRILARNHLRRERSNHTLRTEALVAEVYIRLQGVKHLKVTDRAHFFGIASNAMKQVLVDYAREQATEKRGGRCDRVHFDDLDVFTADQNTEILKINQAIIELAAIDRLKAAIVVMRYFGGMTIEDVAHVLEISPATVKREWQSARARLQRTILGLPRTANSIPV